MNITNLYYIKMTTEFEEYNHEQDTLELFNILKKRKCQ